MDRAKRTRINSCEQSKSKKKIAINQGQLGDCVTTIQQAATNSSSKISPSFRLLLFTLLYQHCSLWLFSLNWTLASSSNNISYGKQKRTTHTHTHRFIVHTCAKNFVNQKEKERHTHHTHTHRKIHNT